MKEIRKKIASVLKDVVHDPTMTQEVFWENEVRANMLISISLLVAAGLLLIFWVLNAFGVLAISSEYVLPIFLVGIVAFVIPSGTSILFRGEKSWIKYLLLISVTISLAYLDSILTFNAPLLIVLPVAFSCRYYSCSLTVKMTLLTSILFTVSAMLGAIVNFSNPDLNFVSSELGGYIQNVMLLSFLPKWITFVAFSAFCYEIARYGRNMVLKQNEISQKAARVNTELEMASLIQNQALPRVESLPENSFRQFDLAAEMDPAKEVGGDFFDFFYPDPSHLALMIADVADKGVAASLYMMMSKTLLESRVSVTLSPGQVLENVNRQLFENSTKGMFVTAWLGILDLRTGELVTANAGHEYPVLRRKDGEFELIKDKHGLVLGGWAPMKYPELRIQMNEGDTLFVYTDGVPEANDAGGQMFGLERMVESLNRYRDCDMKGLIAGLKTDLGGFVAGAPQFDDTTMLAFRLQEAKESTGLLVKPVTEETENVQRYVSDTIGENTLPEEQCNTIAIAVDEIFSNLVKFSGAGQVQVLCEVEADRVQLTFTDDGVRFDPLSRKETAPAEGQDRETGGLGLIITKKIMDKVEYRYENNRNILTVTSQRKESQR